MLFSFTHSFLRISCLVTYAFRESPIISTFGVLSSFSAFCSSSSYTSSSFSWSSTFFVFILLIGIRRLNWEPFRSHFLIHQSVSWVEKARCVFVCRSGRLVVLRAASHTYRKRRRRRRGRKIKKKIHVLEKGVTYFYTIPLYVKQNCARSIECLVHLFTDLPTR